MVTGNPRIIHRRISESERDCDWCYERKKGLHGRDAMERPNSDRGFREELSEEGSMGQLEGRDRPVEEYSR